MIAFTSPQAQGVESHPIVYGLPQLIIFFSWSTRQSTHPDHQMFLLAQTVTVSTGGRGSGDGAAQAIRLGVFPKKPT